MGPFDFQCVCSLPPGINTTAKSIGITSYQLSNLFCLQDALYILRCFLQLVYRRPRHLCTSQPAGVQPCPRSWPLQWKASGSADPNHGSSPALYGRCGDISQRNMARLRKCSADMLLLSSGSC